MDSFIDDFGTPAAIEKAFAATNPADGFVYASHFARLLENTSVKVVDADTAPPQVVVHHAEDSTTAPGGAILLFDDTSASPGASTAEWAIPAHVADSLILAAGTLLDDERLVQSRASLRAERTLRSPAWLTQLHEVRPCRALLMGTVGTHLEYLLVEVGTPAENFTVAVHTGHQGSRSALIRIEAAFFTLEGFLDIEFTRGADRSSTMTVLSGADTHARLEEALKNFQPDRYDTSSGEDLLPLARWITKSIERNGVHRIRESRD